MNFHILAKKNFGPGVNYHSARVERVFKVTQTQGSRLATNNSGGGEISSSSSSRSCGTFDFRENAKTNLPSRSTEKNLKLYLGLKR